MYRLGSRVTENHEQDPLRVYTSGIQKLFPSPELRSDVSHDLFNRHSFLTRWRTLPPQTFDVASSSLEVAVFATGIFALTGTHVFKDLIMIGPAPGGTLCSAQPSLHSKYLRRTRSCKCPTP